MLNENELGRLRRELEKRAEQLRVEMSDKLDQARENTGVIAEPGDAGDQSTAENMRDVGLAEADRDRAEFVQVRAALARMDDGTYGTCTDCGQEIGDDRLRAQPLAVRCVICQDRFERSHAFHRPTM